MKQILEAIVAAGGDPIQIGGCVRDSLLGIPSKDTDVEVYGLGSSQLCEVLSKFGKVDIVGQSFGVIKLFSKEGEFDFSLPRTDNKIGRGHKEFEVIVDPGLSPEEAAKRRDFTINAIGRRIDGSLLDPFNGAQDLKDGILRATSDHFGEDPLRVLRGFQFASRFDLNTTPETIKQCQQLVEEFDTLPKERVWGEFDKWAIKGKVPSKGLNLLVESNWIEKFPELDHLRGVPQDPEWHPEGDAWVHTKLVCDEAAKIAERENLVGEDRIVLILAALCHDLGKALPINGGTTEFSRGKWRSPGHDEAGVPLTRSFLERIGCFERIIERVLPLVREHMVCASTEKVNKRIVRRLAVRLGKATIRELMFLIEADHSGRPPLPGGLPEMGKEILEVAANLQLEVSKPKGLIGGNHLIVRGLTPGPIFSLIINKCFEAQLDGVFVDEASGEKFLDQVILEVQNA